MPERRVIIRSTGGLMTAALVGMVASGGCAELQGLLPPFPGGELMPGPSPSATITPTATVSAADLTGQWLFGSSDEPSPGPVLACYPFKVWNLTQTGTKLHGSVLACMGPCSAFTEETDGTNASGSVTLTGIAKDDPTATGSPVAYSLQFDPATQHLVGTRNAQSFWAAPFIPKPASICGPGPA